MISSLKNTGKKTLRITGTNTDCGCTVPTHTKGEIAAGAIDKISVTFDATGKSGKIDKKIAVYTNSIPKSYLLTISGEVINAKTEQ